MSGCATFHEYKVYLDKYSHIFIVYIDRDFKVLLEFMQGTPNPDLR